MKSRIGTIISIILLFNQAFSCTTKVSEWTLLNYRPTSYQLLYFNKGEPAPAIIQEHEKIKPVLEKANLHLHMVDVSRLKNDWEQMAFAMIPGEDLPVYALYYQNQLFAQFHDPHLLTSLVVSPVRTTIANELKSGKLCVLLYLKSGNSAQDQAGTDVLEKALSKSILKDIIEIIPLDREHPAEQWLIQMLLKVEPDLEMLSQPMLFGIFGRFRVLEPLVGKGITAENIDYLIQFMTADCSCLIKDQMPGIDMLYLNQWEAVKPALLNGIIGE